MKNPNRRIIHFLCIVLLCAEVQLIHSKTYVITHTGDSGQGSLRWAMEQSNGTDPDTIRFDIPASDPGFDGTVWHIQPLTKLPSVSDDGTVLMGESQSGSAGETNPDGPEILLDGSAMEDNYGLVLYSSDNRVSGFILNGFRSYGIQITGSEANRNRIFGNYFGTQANGADSAFIGGSVSLEYGSRHNRVGGSTPGARNLMSGKNTCIYIMQSDSNIITGNFIGLDCTGKKLLGNTGDGITIADSRANCIGGSLSGEGNVICGRGDNGIYLTGNFNTRENRILGNYIGTDVTGSQALGFNDAGVSLGNGARANRIGGTGSGEANVISGHPGYGVYIYTADTDSNMIAGNLIGTDASGTAALPNSYGGVCLYNGPKANQIGPGNIIKFNMHGILMQYDVTQYNRITRNSISGNYGNGIVFFGGANSGIAPPSLLQTASGLEGTAVPDAVVEIFSDSTRQGAVYEGSAVADGSGNFTWTGTPRGPFVTATATDTQGNTSEFSSPLMFTAVEEMNRVSPEAFSLSQNCPNPFNPITKIRFHLNHSCHVILRVLDIKGEQIALLLHDYFKAGNHEVRFDASGFASGLYLYQIQSGEFIMVRKMIVME
jgi:hypothetical protein